MSILKSYERPIRRGRGVNRREKGVIYAHLVDKTLYIGWSMCNSTAGDRFDKDHGRSLARGRAASTANPQVKALNVVGNSGPTPADMLMAGIPQSAVQPIAELVKKILGHNEVSLIRISAKNKVDRDAKLVQALRAYMNEKGLEVSDTFQPLW